MLISNEVVHFGHGGRFQVHALGCNALQGRVVEHNLTHIELDSSNERSSTYDTISMQS